MRIETFVPWTLVKRKVRREVVTRIEAPAVFQEELRREKQQRKQEEHSPLLRSLGLAHYWQQLLDDGKFRSITEIAAAEGMDVGRVSRMLRLAHLSPTSTSAILDGTDGQRYSISAVSVTNKWTDSVPIRQDPRPRGGYATA